MENYKICKPVILCVGTVNVTGDSVGPLVGDALIKLGVDAYVYGKTKRPVNGINYEKYVEFIKNNHPESIVIAVDACLGKKDDVGKTKYAATKLRAGAALKKTLPSFGDLTVLCVVAEKSKDNLHALIAADKDMVSSLAEKTAEKIFSLVEYLRLNYKEQHKIKTSTPMHLGLRS